MADRLLTTAASVLDMSPGDITDEASMESCPSWDSLNHFRLILAVEQEFGARFSSDVIPDLVSISRIRRELEKLGKSTT
jgi:acyl carrier protein